jgi:hypothetical protein
MVAVTSPATNPCPAHFPHLSILFLVFVIFFDVVILFYDLKYTLVVRRSNFCFVLNFLYIIFYQKKPHYLFHIIKCWIINIKRIISAICMMVSLLLGINNMVFYRFDAAICAISLKLFIASPFYFKLYPFLCFVNIYSQKISKIISPNLI